MNVIRKNTIKRILNFGVQEKTVMKWSGGMWSSGKWPDPYPETFNSLYDNKYI